VANSRKQGTEKRDWNRKLAAQTVASLKPGQWTTETFGRGEGALQARGTATGSSFYFRYTGPKGPERIKVPAFDESGQPMTLANARKYARKLSARYQDGERDLKAALAAEERERARARTKAEKADRDASEREQATLGALLGAYCDRQENLGKADARGVRNLVSLHVEQAFPELWAKPAADVSIDDVLEMLGALTEAGKLRTAGKLRSYLKASFSLALTSGKSAQKRAFQRFKVGSNPAGDIDPIEGANKARDRALSVAELRALWQRLQSIDEPIGPLVRFYLLTGGQRFAQLRRATLSSISDEGLTLWDRKGKRKEPRRHVVPLLPEALEEMKAMASPRLGDYVFTLTNGQTGADHGDAFRRVRAICNEMIAAGEIETLQHFATNGKAESVCGYSEEMELFKTRAANELGIRNPEAVKVETRPAPFTISDLRRTIETRLAALKVPMDTRAQLQSHGISGVQARHYDRHDYADEKREALERLRDIDLAWDEIAYFQVGDNPGRKEPGTGEINFSNIFKFIHRRAEEEGRDFIVGMEHGNSIGGREGCRAVIDAYAGADDFLEK